MLRGHVFHPTVEEELIMEEQAERRESAVEPEGEGLQRPTADALGP